MTRKKSGLIFDRLSVTWLLVLINLLFFAMAKIFFSEDYLDYFALKPIFILHGTHLWTLLTNFFVHADIFHLLINLFLLISFGSVCEKIIGKKRFLFFYFVSGLIISLIFVILSGLFSFGGIGLKIFGAGDSFALGASGVIFAIAGILIVLVPKYKFSIVFLPFSLKAYVAIPLLLILMWVVSLWMNLPVGNVSHLSGLIIGVVYGFFLRTRDNKKFVY